MSEDPTVLVVDDLPQNARLLDAVLAPRGYRVVTAESGADALRLLDEQPPDLVRRATANHLASPADRP